LDIIQLTKLKGTLYFTGVDKDGQICVGTLPVSRIGKQKVEWMTACLVN